MSDERPFCPTCDLGVNACTCELGPPGSKGRRVDWDDDELLRLRFEERLSLDRIGRRFGCSANSVRERLRKLGRPTEGLGGGRRRWSDEDIIGALRAWRDRHGRQPSYDEWKARGASPSAWAIVQRFDGWANALVEAGMDGRMVGDWRTVEERELWDRETGALQARVDMGETLTQIAAGVGTTPQALGRRLARWRAFYGGEHREPSAGGSAA